jgi:phosphoribosylformimino-5-aminoimidazole carboxamide ribotide isomerase
MIIFPAIDLRQGRCVRLYQGDPDRQFVYSDDPIATAQRWVEEGATWIHVVNLDGAFGVDSPNPQVVQKMVAALKEWNVQVQFGGGLRSLADIENALSWGVARVILGTVAISHPEIVREAVIRFGAERVVGGIDAKQGMVATHGWVETSDVTALDLALQLKSAGVQRIVYTDIGRDGTHQGINIALTGELAQKSGLKVIASGGVGHLDHLRQVRWIEPYGVEGAIVGKALYDGVFTLEEAIETIQE